MNVKKVLIIEGLVNTFIMLAKLIVGLLTNSAAIIGDALHSLTDIANNAIAYMAMRVAQSPPDSDHPYGHQKFEQLAVFALGALLTIVAFELALNAIKRFGEPVAQSKVGLVVMLIALSANIALTVWEHYWAKRLDSDILHADAGHTLSDVLTTLAVIIGWQLAAQGYYWLDTVFALLVSGIIFYLAFKLFQRAIPILVDQSVHDPAEIKDAVDRIGAVKAVRQVRSRSSGDASAADVVVSVDPSLTTAQSHQIADDIEKMLLEHFDINDVIVHIEPHD